MEKKLKSKFFRLIDEALSLNQESIIKNLYKIQPFITEEMEILYNEDIEILELVARTFAFIEMEIHFMNNKVVILSCPEEKKDFIDWLVKFFIYLESSDQYYFDNIQYFMYEANENHYSVFNSQFAPAELELDKMLFGIEKLNVEFKL